MPQGLQCFDSTGYPIVDVTTRLTRVLGTFETGTANGSFTNADLALGTPWFYLYPTETVIGSRMPCHIVFSGTTVSWTFDPIPGYTHSGYNVKTNQQVMYGVF